MARTVSIPSGRGFWAGEVRTVLIDGEPWVSIPSGRGFWAGRIRPAPKTSISKVSIPSGRGFWAGMNDLRRIPRHPPSLNPLWSGLLGRLQCGTRPVALSSRLNPLWSGLLGRQNSPAPTWTTRSPSSQSPLVGASGPAKVGDLARILGVCLNPLWSGLLGRRTPRLVRVLKRLLLNRVQVSIPSGRGFWAGSPCRAKIPIPARKSQSPLVGASGPAHPNLSVTFSGLEVSIPSGRGFWAG